MHKNIWMLLAAVVMVLLMQARASADEAAMPVPKSATGLSAAASQMPDLTGRQQYAAEIRLYDDNEKLIAETAIAILDGWPGVISTTANRMEQGPDGASRPFQSLTMMVVIETGCCGCWPSLDNTRAIVDEALNQAEMIGVGPATVWIYHPGASRYEVSISELVLDENGQAEQTIPCGTACGWLPCMEPVAPEMIPEETGVGGGGNWWQKGSY